MTDVQTPTADATTASPWAHGVAVFAGVIMIVGGAFQAVEGLAGIVHDKYLVVLPNYIYAFDLTVWGWLHLLVGLALLAIGIFLIKRSDLGSGRRHDRRGNIRATQLRLAAVLTVVGAPDHRH